MPAIESGSYRHTTCPWCRLFTPTGDLQDLEAGMLANAEGNSVRQRIAELSFSRRVRDFPVASVQALLQVRSVGETVEQQWRDALAAAHRDFLAPLRSRKGVQQLQYATLQRLEKTYTPEHGRPPSLAHIRTPSVFAALVAQVRRRFQGLCAALK